MYSGGRRIESSAVAALAPVVMLLPVTLAALFVFWFPIHLVWDVSYRLFAVVYLASVVVLFMRPVQVIVLARLLGTRWPTRDERVRLDTAWRSVLQAAGLPARRYVLAVLPADELNAFACGGHLVVVTSLAIEALPRDELAGVLAHELSHHLGFHTVALTIAQWLSVPVLVLSRIGFFLQNVAAAATTSYASHSAALTAIGRVVSALAERRVVVVPQRVAGRQRRRQPGRTRGRVPGRPARSLDGLRWRAVERAAAGHRPRWWRTTAIVARTLGGHTSGRPHSRRQDRGQAAGDVDGSPSVMQCSSRTNAPVPAPRWC